MPKTIFQRLSKIIGIQKISIMIDFGMQPNVSFSLGKYAKILKMKVNLPPNQFNVFTFSLRKSGSSKWVQTDVKDTMGKSDKDDKQ